MINISFSKVLPLLVSQAVQKNEQGWAAQLKLIEKYLALAA